MQGVLHSGGLLRQVSARRAGDACDGSYLDRCGRAGNDSSVCFSRGDAPQRSQIAGGQASLAEQCKDGRRLQRALLGRRLGVCGRWRAGVLQAECAQGPITAPALLPSIPDAKRQCRRPEPLKPATPAVSFLFLLPQPACTLPACIFLTLPAPY